MKYLKNIFILLADFMQGLKPSVVAVIMGVLFAVAFWNYVKFMKKNKKEDSKINNVGTLCSFLVCLAVIVLLIAALKY